MRDREKDDTKEGMSHILLTPGPTPLHPRTQEALGKTLLGHMDREVFALNRELKKGIRAMYGASEDSFAAVLAGTGSLGMEAGFANLLQEGEVVVVGHNGAFGERMAEMAERAGGQVRRVGAALGRALDAQELLEAAKDARVVALVHGETSTGVKNPVAEVAQELHGTEALLLVDAVTTAGMEPFYMREWGIDYAYTGSQKCLSAPPGLAPIVVSEQAMQKAKAKKRSWYCDFVGLSHYWEEESYHHTVPVNLHYALGAALEVAQEEGWAARAERVQKMGRAVAATLQPLGFSYFVEEEKERLPTVLALRVPEGLDEGEVRKALRERGISVAGGLGQTAGVIWRLGLMGESARPQPYRVLMKALEEWLGDGLLEQFEAALEAEGLED